VVDGKVINRELVWRSDERDCAEAGTRILLRIRLTRDIFEYVMIT
jgi:hypothetical protein